MNKGFPYGNWRHFNWSLVTSKIYPSTTHLFSFGNSPPLQFICILLHFFFLNASLCICSTFAFPGLTLCISVNPLFCYNFGLIFLLFFFWFIVTLHFYLLLPVFLVFLPSFPPSFYSLDCKQASRTKVLFFFIDHTVSYLLCWGLLVAGHCSIPTEWSLFICKPQNTELQSNLQSRSRLYNLLYAAFTGGISGGIVVITQALNDI